jgi:hypothetical protein
VARERAVKLTLVGSERGVTKMFVDAGSASKVLSSGVQHATTRLALYAGGAEAARRVVLGSIHATSDLGETTSKTTRVFGPAADAVFKFGKTSAESVGLSTQKAEEAAATFGNLFTGMKIGQQPAADMSVRMVQLAGDLASFNNADPSQVLQDIRSGLVGEAEPLRKYGILLDDATLRQEALRLGLIKTTKDALPPAIKAQASYSLILKQSKTAQGDFARTSDELANSERIWRAEVTNLAAQFGKVLLPALRTGTHVATDLATGFIRLDEATGGLASKALLGVVAVGGLGLAVGKTVKFVADARAGWVALRGAKVANVATDAALGTAEDVLATKTARAGVVAETAGGRWRLLGGSIGSLARVGGVVGIVTALAIGADKLARASADAANTRRVSDLVGDPAKLATARERLAEVTAQLERVPPPLRDATLAGRQLGAEQGRLQTAIAGAEAATRGQTGALGAQGPVAHQAAGAITATELANRHAAAQATMYRRELIKQIGTVQEAIPVFEGFGHGRNLTSKKLLENLRAEVGGMGTWATDIQILQKKGADPKFIAALSVKGPAYLHAMATGSDKELRLAQGFFQERMAAARKIAELELRLAGTNAPQGFGRNLRAQGQFVATAARATAARAESQFRRTAAVADDYGRQAGRGFGQGLGDRANLARIGRTSANMAKVVSQYLRTQSPSELGPFSQGGGPEGWGRAWMTSYLKGMASQIDQVGTFLADSLGGKLPSGGQVMSIVKSIASRLGWGSGGQWNALAQLITHESGWRPTAQNPTSTAYGLFQFLDSTWASTGIAKTSDPGRQTVAGLRYIGSRYGTPVGAWNFWQRHHWYGAGGVIPEEVFGIGKSGATYSFAERGRVERYVPPGGAGGGGGMRLHPDDLRSLAELIAGHTHDIKVDAERLAAAVATGTRRLERR